jgi:uncharacterized protein YbjT (DUF2867 family)
MRARFLPMSRLAAGRLTEGMTTIFLAGGTGKTGHRVASRLRARGIPFHIGSRRAERPFDWADPGTWPAALADSDAAYLAYAPDLAVPGAADQVAHFTKVATAHGVRRFTLLSGRGEPDAQAAEEAVRAVAPQVTVLRASWMNQNFDEGSFLDMVRAGAVTLPVGPVGEPFVDAGDIADAAVATLLDDGHAGRLYELTGPRLLSFADAVAEIAAATGRDVHFERIGLDDFTAALAGTGTPADAVALIRYLFAEVLDGRNASVADGVAQCLGRPARDFRDYAARAAASGAWVQGSAGDRTAMALVGPRAPQHEPGRAVRTGTTSSTRSSAFRPARIGDDDGGRRGIGGRGHG